MTSFFGDDAILGRYISIISAILLIVLSSNKSRLFLLTAIITTTTIILLLSGDRSPIFCFYFFLILFFLTHQELKKYFYLFIPIIIFISFIIFYINENALERLLFQSYSQIKSANFIAPSEHYLDHYKSALLMGKENIIFGQGTNLFEHLCNLEIYKVSSQSCSTHPHNFYIQIFQNWD